MDQLLSSDLLMGYGLMNKISTGWPLLDTLLCLFIPILLKTAIPWLTRIVSEYFTTPEDAEPGSYTRVIEFTKVNDYWWYYDDDSSEPANSELQRALLNQINHCCQVLKDLPSAELQLRKKPHKIQDAPVQAKSESEDGNDSDGQPEQYDYMVNHVPALDAWVDLKNGISFMRSREETHTQSGGTTTSTTTTTKFFLRSFAKDGEAKVNKFVEDALTLYKEQQAGKVDHARYLYVPVLNTFGTNKDEAPGTAHYKRYKLSEERTFESLFHPDKAPILHLVNQFLHKQGKFGIPGYPQKLGFLLYGPPGTGKTSFIKALSQYTKRSVISIPLSKISTNQELMDIMFDQKISVEGQDSINLSHAKTIFVMEDVDAASHVVSRRAQAETASLAAVAKQVITTAANDTSDEDDQDGQEDKGNSKQPKKANKSDKKQAKVQKDKSDVSLGPMAQKWLAREDELNLAGLLNVLDGVVDTPNRIIIMTTNHPEKLDPALIRPGRINKKIYMGRIRLPEALSMMRHYFGDVSPQLEARLRVSFIDEALSPAEVEAMCADFDTAEDMVEQLEAKFGGRYMQPDTTPYVKVL